MHVHILGICGTFMGGIARLACAAGHTVSGSDANIYPPMSTQLEQLGIPIMPLDSAAQFDQDIDQVVVGNVMSRGYPAVEAMLDRGLRYTSGPQWLAENILTDRHVIAVAGTHGKTTTTSMVAWILQSAGLEPGFLVGGVPQDFGESARLGGEKYFVVEADEYDSAFFDKRSKFVHYRPNTLILNNLEFDHADIFTNLDQIRQQFHHLIRTVPPSGQIVCNHDDQNLAATIEMGCWSGCQTFSLQSTEADWRLSQSQLFYHDEHYQPWNPAMPGNHNHANALAAIAASHHVGVDISLAMEAMSSFGGVARRLQLRDTVNGVRVYDDFAHHPTAIAATLNCFKDCTGRLIAILEPRSSTMKRDIHLEQLAQSLNSADQVWIYQPSDLEWDASRFVSRFSKGHAVNDVQTLLDNLVPDLRGDDIVLIMSNGGFDNIHQRLIERLRNEI